MLQATPVVLAAIHDRLLYININSVTEHFVLVCTLLMIAIAMRHGY